MVKDISVILQEIEEEIVDLETYEWRKGVYWTLYEIKKRLKLHF